MPPKPSEDLTLVEVSLLGTAARFLAAHQVASEHPLGAERYAHFNAKVREEMGAVNTKFKSFNQDAKMPRVHPMIQLMAAEWNGAVAECREPRWDAIPASYIVQTCKTNAAAHPEWHPDLSAPDLSAYLRGLPQKKYWWLQELEDVTMEDARAPQPAPPPKTGPRTRSAKGKAKVTPPAPVDVPQSTTTPQPPVLKGKKRSAPSDTPADVNPDPILDVDGESTPKKADVPPGVPRVQVDDASPPRATQRARMESASPVVQVATELGRCGPCREKNILECRSQGSVRRLTTACQQCSTSRKSCDPPPAWAVPIFEAANPRAGSPAYTGRDHRIDYLMQQTHNLSIMLNALCEKEGIVPSSLPGFGQPPSLRRSHSPSIQSVSSVGVPISSLGLSDTQSGAETSAQGRRSAGKGKGSSRGSSGSRA